MPTYVSGSSSNFTPAPEGTHQAVCVDVIDNGIVETQYGPKKKVSVRWQINERMKDGKPFLVQKRYTASLNEKAVLRHDLEAWRGKAFTFDELARFDLDLLLGANALINIVHNKDAKGSIWANVMSISPLVRGMAKIAPDSYIKERDRAPQPAANGNGTGHGDANEDEREYGTDDSAVPF